MFLRIKNLNFLAFLLIFLSYSNRIFAQHLSPTYTSNLWTIQSAPTYKNTPWDVAPRTAYSVDVQSTFLTPTPEETPPVGMREYGQWLDKEASKIKKNPNASSFLPSKPDAPSNLKIVPGDGSAHLTWDAMPRAFCYSIYISVDGKKFKLRLMKPVKINDISFGVLKNGKTYYFGVIAVGKGGESTMSVQRVIPGIKKNN
jgi:hypothetical protein